MVKKFLIISSSIIFSLIIILLLYRYSSNKVEDKKILNQIQQIEDLITAKQIYKEILYSKETKDFLWIPLSNKEFLISINYNVLAGIDLSKGFEISRSNDIITITLPKAEVLSIDADDSSIKEYFIKERFFQLYRDDYFTMIQNSKESILEGESIKMLLSDSEENAKEILKTLLELSGIKVEVEFSASLKRRED